MLRMNVGTYLVWDVSTLLSVVTDYLSLEVGSGNVISGSLP